MNQTLASILFLQKNKTSKIFDELARYFIVDKANETQSSLHTVYYVGKYFKNRALRRLIRNARYRLVFLFRILSSLLLLNYIRIGYFHFHQGHEILLLFDWRTNSRKYPCSVSGLVISEEDNSRKGPRPECSKLDSKYAACSSDNMPGMFMLMRFICTCPVECS